MHELVGRLMRADTHLLDEPLVPYYHDVYDHVLRVAETVDSARDRVGSILDTNLNEQGHQLNEITKKLGAWAAIIAVPTAVTGFYGQNVPYPGFGHGSGFIASAFIILDSPGACTPRSNVATGCNRPVGATTTPIESVGVRVDLLFQCRGRTARWFIPTGRHHTNPSSDRRSLRQRPTPPHPPILAPSRHGQ